MEVALMKKLIAAALMVSLAASLASCGSKEAHMQLKTLTPDIASPDVVDAIDNAPYTALAQFCSKLHKVCAESAADGENTLVSPLSAYIALSMMKEGADGKTLEEMEAVMGSVLPEDMRSLISHLITLEETQLAIANSVWLDSHFEPKEEFLRVLAEKYFAEGFQTELKNAESDVNLWIEEKTSGLIKNMLDKSSLDSSVMALVNAVYMKAKWAIEFSPEATRERQFTNADGTASTVDFMFRKANHKVIETDDYIGVSLPYSDATLEFVALMPNDNSLKIADLVAKVADNGGWGAVANSAKIEQTKLYIPKFEHQSSTSLVETLKQMGIGAAFDPSAASFRGIAEEIFVDGVIQNAVLKLDEGGTEAAAATVITVAPTSAMPPPLEVRTIDFDRPFAFAVVDTATGAVLFCGEHNSAK